jgi:O-antigen/teichoic acid export membrane protein
MFRHGLYNMLGAGCRALLNLATVPLLIRLIGLEEYGLLTWITAAVGLVSIAGAGLSTSATVFVARDLGRRDTAGLGQTLTVTIGATLVLATLAAAAVWIGTTHIPGATRMTMGAREHEASRALAFGAILVWAKMMQNVLVSVQQAYGRYRLLSGLATAEALVTNAGLVVVATDGGRVATLVEWQAASAVLALLAHSYMARALLRGGSTPLRVSGSKAWEIARYSALSWLATLGGALFAQADRLVVGAFLGPAALGAYGAITSVAAQINSASALPIQPVLPLASELLAQGEQRLAALQEQVRRATAANAAIALGAGAALTTLAPLVLHILIPDHSVDYVHDFQLAVVIYSLYSLNAVSFYVLFASEAVASGAASLLLIAGLGVRFGLTGAMAGNVGYVVTLLLIPIAARRLSLPPGLSFAWIRAPLVMFVVFVVLAVVRSYQPAIRGLLAVAECMLFAGWLLFSQSTAAAPAQ